MKLAVKAVMLDLDGTLINTAPEIAQAANSMLAALDLPALTVKQVSDYIGHGAQTLIKRCVQAAMGAEPAVGILQRAEQIFFECYQQCAEASQPYAGVVAGLERLCTDGFKLACVTNKPAAFTQPLLHKSGLAQYFLQVISGDTLAAKKPSPVQLLHICAKFELPPAQAVMVGDSATDIAAAKAAGCYIVTVPYGYNHGQLIDDDAVDAKITSLEHLPVLLELKR